MNVRSTTSLSTYQYHLWSEVRNKYSIQVQLGRRYKKIVQKINNDDGNYANIGIIYLFVKRVATNYYL